MANYYASSSTSRDSARRYTTPIDNSSRPNAYHLQPPTNNDTHQNHYNSNGYGWSLPQQSVPTSGTQQDYPNNSWQDRSETSTSYSYQRDAYPSAESTMVNHQGYRPRHSYNSQNTQALNSLAYASGLEPAATTISNSRMSASHAGAGYNVSAVSAGSQQRVSSPANAGPRYANGTQQAPQTNTYPSQRHKASVSTGSNDMAMNAAAALAGGVRNKHTNNSQQIASGVSARQTASPISAPVQTMTNLSSHVQPQYQKDFSPVQQHRQPSNNGRSSAQNAPPELHAAIANVTNSIRSAEQAMASQGRFPEKNSSPLITQKTAQRLSSTVHPQSIANLVSNQNQAEQHNYNNVDNLGDMPHFIDPSQVFNPYHREHERKKREAAEVEKRQKAEEQRSIEEGRRTAESASQKAPEPTATPNSKLKLTKKTTVADSTLSSKKTDKPEATTTVSPTIAEDSMAIEMQKMMSKMKEYRSSNPALFSKLWNDMKGTGGVATSTATANIHSPPSQATQLPPAGVSGKATTPAKRPTKAEPQHNSPAGVPGNGYKVVVEDNPDGLPDLGRFPAERRIRHSYSKHKSEQSVTLSQPQSAATLTTTTSTPVPKVASNSSAHPVELNNTWAEPRRRAVATAAIHLLKANPENASAKTTAQDICNLLERNPSYNDLCTALESQGLKFQRTSLARELLKNVPELSVSAAKRTIPSNTATSAANIVIPNKQATMTQPRTESMNTSTPMAPPIPLIDQALKDVLPPPQSVPVITGLSTVKEEGPKSVQKPPVKTAKARIPAGHKSDPPVGSKEAAARKRDFSELIDLTELGEDENYVLPPPKQQKVDSEPPVDPFRQSILNMEASFGNTSQPLRFDPQAQFPAQQPPPAAAKPPVQAPYQMPAPPTWADAGQSHYQQDNSRNKMILAKKMDRIEAFQKTFYDPRTVARDILIASGRHSSERPLNLHLGVLLTSYIDMESDLSTFDWDSVDPGGPPAPKVDVIDVLAAPPRFKLGERVQKRQKLDQSRDRMHKAGYMQTNDHVANKSGDKVPANHSAPLNAPPKASTPLPSSSQAKASSKHRPYNEIQHADLFVSRKNTPLRNSPSHDRKISIDIPLGHSRSTPQHSTAKSTSESQMEVTPKRRGRPPGAKNKHPSVAALKKQIQTTSTNSGPEQIPEQVPEPYMHVYKCKWVKCHAELHNLDTLRRHIVKKHATDEQQVKGEDLVCWWKKCRYLQPDNDGAVGPIQTFKDADNWIAHIQKDHLEPIAAKFGDGPQATRTGKQNTSDFDLTRFLYQTPSKTATRTLSHTDFQNVEETRTRYLADSQGRATTPLVSSDGNQSEPHDAMNLIESFPQGPKTDKQKADNAAQNAFLKAHGNRHKDGRRAAEEIVRAMEVRKAKIGPGIDRGGCTLINEARRSTFVQAPGISRVVDYEY